MSDFDIIFGLALLTAVVGLIGCILYSMNKSDADHADFIKQLQEERKKVYDEANDHFKTMREQREKANREHYELIKRIGQLPGGKDYEP